MKRVMILFLLAAVLLAGCAAGQQTPREPYTQIVNDMELLIDPQNQTITYGEDVYRYAFGENEVNITYPNGAVFSEYYIANGASTMGWSNADPSMITNNGAPYLDAYLLMAAVPDSMEFEEHDDDDESSPALFIMGLGLLAIGILQLAVPHSVWYGKFGWAYKDAEPSDLALGLTQATGIFAIVGGIVLLILAFV